MFANSFTGADALEWLMVNLEGVDTEEIASNVANKLIDLGVFYNAQVSCV